MYCLKCALCTEKLVKDCQSEVDDKDHDQRDLITFIREEEEEEEESDFIEEGEMVSSECRKRKKRIGRRAKGKRFLAKKPASKRAKAEQMAKAVELLQSTFENDPTKELLQILRDDMKQSREQEMRYFQLMCGLLTPTAIQTCNPMVVSILIAVLILMIFIIKAIILQNNLCPIRELAAVTQVPHPLGTLH